MCTFGGMGFNVVVKIVYHTHALALGVYVSVFICFSSVVSVRIDVTLIKCKMLHL